MSLRGSSLQAKLVALLLFISLLVLSACGTSTSTTTTSTPGSNATPQTKGPIVVASKKDEEGQILGQIYALLLNQAGFKVTLHLAYGNTPFNFSALKNGDTDLYPEFTATGLNTLSITSTYDPEKDYQAVKQGFEQNYKITWLDKSPLNDGYALCTTKSEATTLGITTISELVAKVSSLTLETPSDGTDFVNNLQKTYGITTKSFKQTQTVDYGIGFSAVQSGQAQINVCYGTDATVPQQNFVFLKDDKNGFPAFNPAPIVRDAVLTKYPEIATILNPVAPLLTNDVSIQLQNSVKTRTDSGESTAKAVKDVATQFLKDHHLIY